MLCPQLAKADATWAKFYTRALARLLNGLRSIPTRGGVTLPAIHQFTTLVRYSGAGVVGQGKAAERIPRAPCSVWTIPLVNNQQAVKLLLLRAILIFGHILATRRIIWPRH